MFISLIVVSFLSLWFRAAWFGLLANYFVKCVGRGIDGDTLAPDFRRPNHFVAEWVLPGFAFVGLIVALNAPSSYLVYRIVADTAEEAVAVLDSVDTGSGEGYEIIPWNPDQAFRLESGEIHEFKADDLPAVAQRADGTWVKVFPSDGLVVVLGPNFRPGDRSPASIGALFGEDNEEDAEGEATSAGAEPSSSEGEGAAQPMPLEGQTFEPTMIEAIRGVEVPTGKIALLLASILFTLLYWPMALARGALSESVLLAFHPVQVMAFVLRAGSAYLAIVATGVAMVMLATICGLALGFFGFSVLVFGAFLYCVAAQGMLVGRLLGSRPDLRAALERR